MRIAMVSPILGEAYGQERVMAISACLLRAAGHQVLRVGEGSPASNLAALKEYSPDIVHFIDQFNHRFMQSVAESFPSVLTAHTLAPTCPASGRVVYDGSAACSKKSGWSCLIHNKFLHCLDGFKSDLHRAHIVYHYQANRKALRYFRSVVAVSDHCEQMLLLDGWPRGKVVQIPNPIEQAQASSLKEAPSPLIVSASRLVPLKGLNTLLDALLLLDDLPWTLWICGDGPLENELKTKAQHPKLVNRVQFQGRVPTDRLRAILASATMVVQPNISSETFGMTVAEASGLGIPVVVSDVPGLTEIIQHEMNGLVVPRNDPASLAAALRRLLTDPHFAAQLGERGREWISQKYAPEIHLKRTVELYERCQGFSNNISNSRVAP